MAPDHVRKGFSGTFADAGTEESDHGSCQCGIVLYTGEDNGNNRSCQDDPGAGSAIRKIKEERYMSETCTHNCNSCNETCSSRQTEKTSFLEPLNPASSVKKVIGIVSGKGGVGKSLVTSLMAVKMNSKGFKTGILDADITGPSIPKAFGIEGGVGMNPEGLMVPAISSTGIEIMSSQPAAGS